jgi:DNA-binding transcriptional LysR family regulator
VRPSSCGEVIVKTCVDAGFEPRIAVESDEYEVLQGYVAAGLGVTLLPDLALPALRADLVVRPTRPEAPKRRVWAVTRAEGARSAATDAMVAVLGGVGEEIAAGAAGAVAAKAA